MIPETRARGYRNTEIKQSPKLAVFYLFVIKYFFLTRKIYSWVNKIQGLARRCCHIEWFERYIFLCPCPIYRITVSNIVPAGSRAGAKYRTRWSGAQNKIIYHKTIISN